MVFSGVGNQAENLMNTSSNYYQYKFFRDQISFNLFPFKLTNKILKK